MDRLWRRRRRPACNLAERGWWGVWGSVLRVLRARARRSLPAELHRLEQRHDQLALLDDRRGGNVARSRVEYLMMRGTMKRILAAFCGLLLLGSAFVAASVHAQSPTFQFPTTPWASYAPAVIQC